MKQFLAPVFGMKLDHNAFRRQRIKIAYVSALLVNALVGLLVFFLITQVTSLQPDIAEAIRLNAEQRMYAQRITTLISLLEDEDSPQQPDVLITELTERLSSLEQTYNIYIQQGVEAEVPLEIAQIYFDTPYSIERQLQAFLESARSLRDRAQGIRDELFHYNYKDFLLLSTQLREKYTSVISIYTTFQQVDFNTLRTITAVVFTTLFFVLMLEGLFIFRPMERTIQHEHQQLVAENELRRRVEDSLRRSEAAYRLLAQHLPDMFVLMFDAELHCVVAEGSALAAVDITRTQIEGKYFKDILSPSLYEKLEPGCLAALAGRSTQIEYRFKDRAYITYIVPIYDDNHTVTGGMITSQDITGRKQMEETLRINESRFRSITENASDVIALVDTHFRIIYANPAYQTTLGYTPSELVQKSVFEYVYPDDLETIRQLERSIISQQPVHGSLQFRHLHADGHAVHMEGQMDAVYAPSGAIQNVVFILRDLTDRQRLQEMQIEREILRHSLEKEQELSALKSHMMTRIAHEFRTPLAIILSSIETLEIYAARLKPEQRMAKRRIISQQIQHLTDMLDDIGMVIRGSFVSEKLQKSRICLQEIIEDVIGKLEKNDYPQERFELNLHEGLIIHGDYGNLKRAFYEIISNAARFSEHNTPIQIQATASDEQVRLQVSDQGIGIHSDDVAHAFEPFFRGRNIDEIGGLGLGLTIAQAVIQAHQGTIELESQLGTGTRITVTIPA